MNREEFVQSQLGRGGPECGALRLAIAEERHLFNPLTQNNTDLAMAAVAALVERLTDRLAAT